METVEPVILWHIEVSHFSEKARWALEFKLVGAGGVDPGRHGQAHAGQLA